MKRKNEQSTRELMGTKELSDYSIRTYRKDELVYFLIQPSNLSVLSEESLSARIYGLMTVLKGITEIEMMCLNSREIFEDNKRYLKNRYSALPAFNSLAILLFGFTISHSLSFKALTLASPFLRNGVSTCTLSTPYASTKDL